jgi:uncharacterized protein (DUF1810 family)
MTDLSMRRQNRSMASHTEQTAGAGLPFDLERFVRAQENDSSYERAVAELRNGRKQTHWMWFVFPQVVGLGHSPTARYFAISGLEEARAYLGHDVLGPRLLECARVLAALEGMGAEEVFGPIDALKLRSSMTLFLRADPNEALFQVVLERFFDGRPDPATDGLV